MAGCVVNCRGDGEDGGGTSVALQVCPVYGTAVVEDGSAKVGLPRPRLAVVESGTRHTERPTGTGTDAVC